MIQVTPAEATLIAAVIGLVSGLLGWLGRGLVFVLRRWWTGAPRQERAAYLNSVTDLAAKLRDNGMTLDDVHKFESIMHNPAVTSSTAANGVVEALAKDAEAPSPFNSNVAMKARTSAAYTVAKAQLEQALMDLRLLLGDHEWQAFEVVQDRWREFRRALEDFALREFEGGTHATLALLMVGLSETERRTEEIKAQVAERKERQG
ncbi:lysozyme inhibitor LprI family protein [Reyranella sp.]|uniref:lysozyme inhibitor LprI family protein n=1 Tax=Reyranella sp. TaxID=1929291 RepID=UPI00122B21C3|nr:lysozyme inhibitor LprI family protein [Reyranella sp.]TAJ89447.1 MAG: DUF1311 domain-containing protein [Reyranella sp.]